MKKITIIGSGAAGILLLLALKKSGITPESITVIDPHFDGGDLMRRWYTVRSNTIWRQILEAVPASEELPPVFQNLDPESPCELRLIAQYLLYVVKDYLKKCNLHCGYVKEIKQETDSTWTISLATTSSSIKSDIVFIATGSEPKQLNLPMPSIPLHIALNSSRLGDYVNKNDHVILFGTAHSSALILKNLLDNGVKKITNFYATPKPYYFARDGDYDGIKQDAAEIADNILAGKYPEIELVSVHDISALVRHTRDADKAIYAIGFEQKKNIKLITSDNKQKEIIDYDGATGRINDCTNAWGFGIAFPNKAEDGIHWDVSVPSFMKHIEKQLPDILSLVRIE